MMIKGINDISGPVIGAQTQSAEDINKIDFLNLLIAQIRNQDPMSPMDNQEFVAQLTQFTTLEEMQGINERLDSSMVQTQSLNNTMMLGLVGKQVTVAGDRISVTEGQASESMLEVIGTGQAAIEVRDAAGNAVATYTRSVSDGMNDISWDGQREDGEQAADGTYSLSVTVQDGSGNSLPFASYMTGLVESLRFENNLAMVEVAGSDFHVSEIFKVSL